MHASAQVNTKYNVILTVLCKKNHLCVQHSSIMTTVVLLIVFIEVLCSARSTCVFFPTILIISIKHQYGLTSTHRQEVYL